MNFSLTPPFTGSIVSGNTDRVTSLNPAAGSFGIKNEVNIAGSVPVIAGFSKIFRVPSGTRTVKVSTDFLVSGTLIVGTLHWGYARAAYLVNIKAMGLSFLGTPNGDDHAFSKTIISLYGASYVYPPNQPSRFDGQLWHTDMDGFALRAGTRSYLLSATIESWAGCGGLASWAFADVFDGTRLLSFSVTTDP